MYIRVKRSKTTYFIRCSPSDKIVDIKQKLQELIDQPVDNQRLTLPETGQVLNDSRTLADQKVDSVIISNFFFLLIFISYILEIY